MPQAMISTPDIARRANLNEETVRRAVARGELKAYRFGRVIRYDPSDVEAWLESRRIVASAHKQVDG